MQRSSTVLRCVYLLVLCVAVMLITYLRPKMMSPVVLSGLGTPFAAVQPFAFVSNLAKLRLAASVYDAEMMQQAPEQYISGLKNPCWHVSTTGSAVHCLPSVFVSSQFTGVDNLVAALNAHPNVVQDAGPESVWGSDWGWWSEHRFKSLNDYLEGISSGGATLKKLQADPGTNLVIDSARSTFAAYWAASSRMHTPFSSLAVGCWKGCHDNFSIIPEQYKNCMDSTCLRQGRASDRAVARKAGLSYKDDAHLPLLIRALYGSRPPKLIIMLRDPVDRMYENYFRRKNYWERHKSNFTLFAAEQLVAWQACLEGSSAGGPDGAGSSAPHTNEDCILHFESLSIREEQVFYHADQLLRGMYAPWLKIWLRFLPTGHVLAVHFDDYLTRPEAVLNKVFAFLDLPLLPPPPIEIEQGDHKSNSRTLYSAQRAVFGEQLAAWGGRSVGVQVIGSKGNRWLTPIGAAAVRAAKEHPPSLKEHTYMQIPMDPATRVALKQFYKPYNQDLAALLLGDKRVLAWNEGV